MPAFSAGEGGGGQIAPGSARGVRDEGLTVCHLVTYEGLLHRTERLQGHEQDMNVRFPPHVADKIPQLFGEGQQHLILVLHLRRHLCEGRVREKSACAPRGVAFRPPIFKMSLGDGPSPPQPFPFL